MKKLALLIPVSSLVLLAGCKHPDVAKEYTVKFVNRNGTVLQESKVAENTLPVYEGEVPSLPPEKEDHQYVYIGWDKDIEKVTQDVTYTATYDNVFLFGSYPQTLVTDLELVKLLNNQPTGDYGYKTYEGKYYFQYTSKQGYIADDGTRVEENDENYIYYEVQPIQWKILLEDNNKAFYTTYKLLTTHIYANVTRDEPEPDVDYDNAYNTSELNTWLNDTSVPARQTDLGGFAWRAFNDGETVNPIDVDNSRLSTLDRQNPFASDTPTNASIFEVSRANLHGYADSYYPSESYDFVDDDIDDKNRMAATTDFARATGAVVNGKYGMYWTRSPANNDWTFGDDDYVYSVMATGHIIQQFADDEGYCARPAIRFAS